MLHIEKDEIKIEGLSSPEDMLNALRNAPPQDKEALAAEIKALSRIEQEFLNNVVEAMGSHLNLQPFGTIDPSRLEAHAKKLVKVARANCRGHGNITGRIGELIEEMLRPPSVSWAQVLKARLTAAVRLKRARSMRRPSKKLAAIARHMRGTMDRLPLFPGVSYDPVFRIIVPVDSSGSMNGNTDLAAALNEIEHIRAAMPNLEIVVLYVDCTVTKTQTLTNKSTLDRVVTGRGGTDFETAFAHVGEQMRRGEKYDLLLYITDGIADPPRTKLPIPVIWLLTPRGSAVCADAGHTTIYMRPYSGGDG